MKALSRGKEVAGNQQGFSLVELIIIIVVLGIIGAIAIPRYIDVKTEAQQAAVQGVAAALASASANNKTIRSAFGTDSGFSVGACTDVTNGLDGGLPSGYTVATTTIATNGTASCVVTGAGSQTASFVGHGIS